MLNTKNKHTFITLGLKLTDRGFLEPEAIGRLKKTLEAYNRQKDSYIIVTGGNIKNHKTEAKAMKNWLVSNGIPEYKVIEENKSENTVENAIYSMNIVDKKNFQSVTLITSDTHIKRAFILFKKLDYYNRLLSSIVFITGKITDSHHSKENILIKSNLSELDKKIKENKE